MNLRSFAGYSVAVLTVLWCVSAMSGKLAVGWPGWSYVTTGVFCLWGIVGAVFLAMGIGAWRWMLPVWALMQIPIVVVDPSGPLVEMVIHASWMKTNTISINGQPVMMSGAGVNWAGLAPLAVFAGQIVFGLHPVIREIGWFEWVRARPRAVASGAVIAGLLAIATVSGAARYWIEAATLKQEDVIARFDVTPQLSEVYLGKHYLGRTPLVLTRPMIAAAGTTLGDGKDARVCLA